MPEMKFIPVINSFDNIEKEAVTLEMRKFRDKQL